MLRTRAANQTSSATPRSTRARRRRRLGTIVLAVAAMASPVPIELSGGRLAAAPLAPVKQVSDEIADAGQPSISADGRWVVFSGTVGERRSVFRTDRTNDQTIELSAIPEGVPSGDTVLPQISADGCVVVAITEVAFDLFRDNDRDLRFDVYRLVVPECGGQVNGWQLVSTANRDGVARDDVFTDSPPALTGSGAVIAYTHQAPGAPEGVATISVVDITVPINEPGRVQLVAGMPAEAPGGAFLYRGARQPVISQNGRHVGFVSDTTASDALPGWGEGPVLGEYATSQVFVWDRQAADQRRAVRLISGRDGQPSAAGGDDPAMSEDGRIVVFTSTDRTLVPANLSNCTPDCPSQVYRFDRDTDRNGIFDEPSRREQLALVSAVDAGVAEVGIPVAGDASSWSPAVNADGSQIAFVTDATNLLPSHRGGGGAATDGDLLVAEFQLGQIRRVLDSAETTGVPGAHGNPSLSKTGQVIAFDTLAGNAIPGQGITRGAGRRVMTVEFVPQLSLAPLDFGTVLLGFESTELYAKVRNSGPAAFEPTDVQVSSANFKITGGTCIRGVIVAAGSTCSVELTFNPTAPRAFSADLTVRGDGAGTPSVTTTLRGAAGEPAILADPGGVDFDTGIVGTMSGTVAIDLKNIGFSPTRLSRLEITGPQAADFRIVIDACSGGRALNPDASCAVGIEFVPKGDGYRSALLVAVAADASGGRPYTTAVLGGFARYKPLFQIAAPTARRGEEFVVGGSGFPASSTLTIGFDDGGAPFATVETGIDGAFLAVLTMPGRVRTGPRLLVASGSGGVVAGVPVEIEGVDDRSVPGAPGFGLG
jgi:Tol biopolymer transport system component